MRGKSVAVLAVSLVALLSLLAFGSVSLRKADPPPPKVRYGQATNEFALDVAASSLPALRVVSLTPVEWDYTDSKVFEVRLRNDTNRTITGFVYARNTAYVPPPSTQEYFARMFDISLEPVLLEAGGSTVLNVNDRDPFRVAAVSYDDGTSEGEAEAVAVLDRRRSQFEVGLREMLTELKGLRDGAVSEKEFAAAADRYAAKIDAELADYKSRSPGDDPPLLHNGPHSPNAAFVRVASELAYYRKTESTAAAIVHMQRTIEARLAQSPNRKKEKLP